MNLIKKMFQKKGVKKVPKKRDELKHQAIVKLSKLKQKKFSEKIFDEFIFVFRLFISKKLDIKKQTTHEELVGKISEKRIKPSIKKKILDLSSRINEIEFKNIKITKEEYRDIILKFEEIIELV